MSRVLNSGWRFWRIIGGPCAAFDAGGGRRGRVGGTAADLRDGAAQVLGAGGKRRPGRRGTPAGCPDRRGIEVVIGEITAIEPEAKAAVVDRAEAGGGRPDRRSRGRRAPESVPGFAEHVHNVYERSSLARAAEALRSTSGGAIAIGIFGVPYTCPPAPYEMAFLVNDSPAAAACRPGWKSSRPSRCRCPSSGRRAVTSSRALVRGRHRLSSKSPGARRRAG